MGVIKEIIERRNAQRRLREEEKAEMERIQREQKKDELIATLREKMAKINNLIDNAGEGIERCHERIKELVKRYGKNSQITKNRAELCVSRRKTIEYFELLVEVWDQAIEKIDMAFEIAGAIELLNASIAEIDNVFSAIKTGDISLLGIRLRRMDMIIKKIIKKLEMQLRISPSVEMNSKEVDKFLNEVEAEVKAEEEERLKEREAERRIRELAGEKAI